MQSIPSSRDAIFSLHDISPSGLDEGLLNSLADYLISQSQKDWIRIRDYNVDPYATLESLWRLDDPRAPAKGSFSSYPGAMVLARAVRSSRKLFLRQIDAQIVGQKGVHSRFAEDQSLFVAAESRGWGELRGCMDLTKQPLGSKEVKKIHEFFKNPSLESWYDICEIRVFYDFYDKESSLRVILNSWDHMHAIDRTGAKFPSPPELRNAISEYVRDGYHIFHLKTEWAATTLNQWLAIQHHAHCSAVDDPLGLAGSSFNLNRFSEHYHHAWKICEFELSTFKELFGNEVAEGELLENGLIESALNHYDQQQDRYPL
jgi:hypothetical protein